MNNTTRPTYLVVGHVTRDLHKGGSSLGGTAAYSALCAQALGRIPAIITACTDDIPINKLGVSNIWRKESSNSTTYENIEGKHGREQILHAIADQIVSNDIPEKWKNVEIVHLGPVADEIDPAIIDLFPTVFIGLTPQGWMRARDEDNMVHYKNWSNADKLLKRADAVVISVEDVIGNEDLIQSYASKTKVLAVTEGHDGARIYWNGDVRHFSAQQTKVVDPTGAGDIFATAFFDRLKTTGDPWASGKFAVQIASRSVQRRGLSGVPTKKEIQSFQIEVIEGK